MGISSALYTALTGLNTNETAIDVIGNNVANANTIGFKYSDIVFETQFSQVLSVGTQPDGTTGGQNPIQLGLGSTVATTTQIFSQGTVQTTGGRTDMAVQGDGFFVLSDGGNDQFYTRNGNMHLDGESYLVNGDGFRVQGYQVDDAFDIIDGQLGDLQILLGDMRRAQATENAVVTGNLNAAGPVGTQGTMIQSQALTEGAGGPAITAATLLSNVYDGATQLFSAGDVITMSGHKGGRRLGAETLTVAATTTAQDLADFMAGAFGINTDPAVPGTPGGSVVAGQIVLEGNYGTLNDIMVESGDIATSGMSSQPLTFTKSQTADGESIYTSFVAYDSLGNEVVMDVTAVFETAATSGNVFRVFMESPDDTDATAVLGTGLLTFDNNGMLTSVSGNVVQIDRLDTGAIDPMQVTLDFSTITGLAATVSELVTTSQDGSPEGTLTNFNVDTTGIIIGTFDNGLTQKLGQVALARFTNPEGLLAQSDNVWRSGPNSGLAILGAPQELGLGSIVSGALELSNTDLARNFVNLILASTGFSANSRVISTADELLREILVLGR